MAATKHRSWLFILFVLLMVLLCAAGVALVIYGSQTNGIPAPKLPGIAPHISWWGSRHG